MLIKNKGTETNKIIKEYNIINDNMEVLYVNERKTANELKLGKEGIVNKIIGEETIKRRLLDLGLIEGTNINTSFNQSIGRSKSFRIRGSLIAIRKEDAKI